jgi:hypothetical protein
MAQPILLGQLIRDCKLVSEAGIKEAMTFATETNCRLGQALVARELISQSLLRACVQAQWMLADEILTFEECRAAIGVVRRTNWPFAEALISLGIDTRSGKGLRIGELLSDAKIIQEKALNEALTVSRRANLPVGHALVTFGMVEPEIVDEVLKVQHQLRFKGANRDEALLHLKEVSSNAQALSRTSSTMTRLLLGGSLMSPESISTVTKIALNSRRSLSEVLPEHSNLKPLTVFCLASLSRRVESGSLSFEQALELARSQIEETLNNLVDREDSDNLTLYTYLRVCGYFTAARLAEFINELNKEEAFINTLLPGDKMPRREKIRLCVEEEEYLKKCLERIFPEDEPIIERYVRSLSLIRLNMITMDESLLLAKQVA